MSVISVGVSRSSNALSLNRSLNALYGLNRKLDQLNQQILSERRYLYGSESPFEASVSISVQMQIERKAQNATNLQSTQSYLSASDSSLSRITGMLDEARVMAHEAINTTTGPVQRSELATSIKTKLQGIFDFSNYRYNNRYLFSGATTDAVPFTWGSESYAIDYSGSMVDLYSWSDSYLLSQTNITGAEVFGAVSEPVAGIDLNPALTGSTLLSTLNGGSGIINGTIRISYVGSDGARESIIDIGRCVTVDDVRNQIAQNAPAGTTIHVGMEADALSLSFVSDDPEGTITITDVGNTLTTRSLGITASTPIVSGTDFKGADLNPALTGTTRLEDLLGSEARTTLRFPGYDNDVVVEAKFNGERYRDSLGEEIPFNDMRIVLRSRSDIAAGSEYAQYDPEANAVTVFINPDYSSASKIVDAINRASDDGAIPPIQASLDALDRKVFGKTDPHPGSGLVNLLPGRSLLAGTLQGGSGEPLDRESGLQIVNGGITHTIGIRDCTTVDDLLGVLNTSQFGLYASINGEKNGINIQSRVSGTDFMIGENGGTTATQLGVRTFSQETRLSELDFNRGVTDFDGPGANATARYQAESSDSGMIFTAKEEGESWNDYRIVFTQTRDPDGGVTVDWNREEKTITIGVNSGVTKACEVVAAFNEQPGPSEAFELHLDGSLGINTGQGVVYEGTTDTAGGSTGGIDFSITRSDGTILEIDIKGAETVGEILDIINNHPRNADGLLQAQLTDYGNGIELVDRSVGGERLTVRREELSTAAIQLGLVPAGQEFFMADSGGLRASLQIDSATEHAMISVTAAYPGTYANDVTVEIVDMNAPGENGVPGFSWDATTQTMRFAIDPGVTTANDLIRIFQESASPEIRNLFSVQNGLNSDGTPSDGTGTVALFPRAVDPNDPSSGIVDAPQLSGGTASRLRGSDPNPLETESVFTALIRLQIAMENDDTREIERAANLLDDTLKLIDTSRADLGIRQNTLDSVQYRLEDEYVQLQQVLSSTLKIDDLSGTILEYNAAKVSYEAALQMSSQMFQLSLLNFL